MLVAYIHQWIYSKCVSFCFRGVLSTRIGSVESLVVILFKLFIFDAYALD